MTRSFGLNCARLARFTALAGVLLALALPGAAQTSQSDIDLLSAKKTELNAALNTGLQEVAAAQAELNKANAANDAAGASRWQAELAARQNRLQAIDSAVTANEAALGEALQKLQAEMTEFGLGKIKVGESLEIFVVEDESLNGTYPVRQGGHVLLPSVGRVRVAGLELTEAEAAVREALARSLIRNPTVVVERPQRGATAADQVVYYVAGEFTLPGLKTFPASLKPTVATVVINNLPLDTADLTRARVLRLVEGRAVVEEINLDEILKGKGLGYDLEIMTGDIIFLPIQQTRSTVYVTGRVGTPGPLQMPANENLTAYSAILRSGGFARFANQGGVYIIREVGGGQKVHIPVNIGRIRRGLSPDVELQGKDIVFVPERFFSF